MDNYYFFIAFCKFSVLNVVTAEGPLGVKHFTKFFKCVANIIQNVYLETVALVGRDNEYLKYILLLNLEISVA